ncbi:hypothetical protein D9M72_602810 [compost metagenome]
MREEGAAARGFVDQFHAERVAVDGDQKQAFLSLEMPRCRLHGLFGGGEMDEAVSKVDGCAVEASAALGFLPQRGRNDLVDDGTHCARLPP